MNCPYYVLFGRGEVLNRWKPVDCPYASSKEKVVPKNRKFAILMADDDKDDCMLVRNALSESTLEYDFHCVENGFDLLDYLRWNGKDENSSFPFPDLIILDLHMPLKDGLTALREIKEDPLLKGIPIMVLTDSKEDEDALQCYCLGVSWFLNKGNWFDDMLKVIKASGRYWIDMMTGVQSIKTA